MSREQFAEAQVLADAIISDPTVGKILVPGDKGHSIITGLSTPENSSEIDWLQVPHVDLEDDTSVAIYHDQKVQKMITFAPAGTIFSLLPTRENVDLSKVNARATRQLFMQNELLAAYHPQKGFTDITMRIIGPLDPRVGWASYNYNGQIMSEKALALAQLQALYDTEKGIEDSALLAASLGVMTGSVAINTSLAEVACATSHENPSLGATKTLLALASLKAGRLQALDLQKKYLVRVAVGHEASSIKTLTFKEVGIETVVSRAHLQAVGLLTHAEKIAVTNPATLGKPLSTAQVLEGMGEVLTALPQRLVAKDSIEATQQDLANNLGIEKLSIVNTEQYG